MDRGRSGQRGVLIRRANGGDLMVNAPLVKACRRGEFSIHAVDTIHAALAILTGRSVSADAGDGSGYAQGSLLHIAVQRARHYWLMASRAGADSVPGQSTQSAAAADGAGPTR